jgi:hypothetical protein
MGSVREVRSQRQVGDVTWHAGIALGIGDDDTVSGVGAESEHDTEQAARAWIEQELPRAAFPEWVTRRPHGTAGAFLFGQLDRGYITALEPAPEWEPDLDAPSWDADLVDGTVRWRRRD